MERIVRRIGIVGIIPVALTALAGAGVLLALDDGGATPTAATGSSLWSPFLANQEPDGGTMEFALEGPVFDGYLETLAEKLGISEEQLREAMKETSLELLDEAVANGDIPEADAAEIREKIEAGGALPFFGGGFGIGKFGGGPEFGVEGPLLHDGAVAEYLGISEEQLRQELNSGKTLAEVGAAHGKSREELKSFLTGLQDDRLQETVEAGKLSEAEADQIRSRMAEHVDALLDGRIQIHVDGDDGLLPGAFGEKIERFFGGSAPRALPWWPGREPNESTETDDTY